MESVNLLRMNISAVIKNESKKDSFYKERNGGTLPSLAALFDEYPGGWKQYAKDVLQNARWGGEMELEFLSKYILKRPIVAIFKRDDGKGVQIWQYNPESEKEPIYLHYKGNSHYELLTRRN